MDESTQQSFLPDGETQQPSDQTSGTNLHQPSTTQASSTDPSSMEFAPMPTPHFGAHAFDMRHMSTALPDYTYTHPQLYQSQMPHASVIDPQHLAYSSFSSQQYPGQFPSQMPSQYQIQINPHHGHYSTFPGNLSGTPPEQSHFQHRIFPLQQQITHHPIMPQQPSYPGYPNQPMGQYGQVPGGPYQSRGGVSYQLPRLQVDNPQVNPSAMRLGPGGQGVRRTSSNSSLNTSTTLRGPPRKPKQSGHALWVGNLPPGTQITDLKDHFSRDATDDIESVFLISKSNCAFVNYKTEDSCTAAMTRFHDSRFRGVRLVCRLRRGSTGAASPALAFTQMDATKLAASSDAEEEEEAIDTTPTASEATELPASNIQVDSSEKMVREKFFIVKSLTVEDLERSVSTGIWATQAHNEENLNQAFKTAESVYLIFSANKSGEYFGYARMESTIDPDATSMKEMETPRQLPRAPVPQPTNVELPLTIPTPATATAPRGHIIDDSARGTIFWEAESALLSPTSAAEASNIPGDSGETSGDDTAGGQIPGTAQQTTFGKPFRISWQSTERLPFYRTRGLRNPWNANREVKIARDGTEIEPTVGRKLIGMFEQQAQINAASRGVMTPSQYGYPQHQQQHQQMPQYPGAMNMAPPYGYGMQQPPYGRPY